MNRPDYFNVIEERLNLLAVQIITRGRLNILDYHGHLENFYQYFLNEVYGWTVTNENNNKQNVEAIDLMTVSLTVGGQNQTKNNLNKMTRTNRMAAHNNKGFLACVTRTMKPLLHRTFGGFGVYDVLLWGLLWISVA